MITKTETVDGKPVRVYHRAGSLSEGSGNYRADEKYAWTHPYGERGECVACTKAQIPQEVKSR